MSVGSVTAIDCFAGAGGLSLGLTQAGIRVCLAFDSDAIAVRTHNQNLGNSAIVAHAEAISGLELLQAASLSRGDCDLVVGGPPCQGFSRQRRGTTEDARNDLVHEFLRLVIEIEPRMFLMENVGALGGPRGRAHLPALLDTAEAAGYRVQKRVLDAAEYGVPQRRRRLFLVGERVDREARFVFPSPTHRDGAFLTVRQAIADLPSPMTDPARAALIPNHGMDNISPLNRRRISHVPEGGGRADIPPELRLPCHALDVDTVGHRAVYGRLSWDRPSGTITTKCNSFTRGRFAHPSEDRNISMREAARLQGFPDEFVFLGGKVDVAHQVGNAVPPPLARQLGLALIAALTPSVNEGVLRARNGAQLALGV